MHHRFNEDMTEDVRGQLADLSQQVAALQKQVRKSGRETYRQTRHMGEDAAEWMRDYAGHALPELRRGAYEMQRSAREHPGTTAGIAAASLVVLCLAAVLFTRR